MKRIIVGMILVLVLSFWMNGNVHGQEAQQTRDGKQQEAHGQEAQQTSDGKQQEAHGQEAQQTNGISGSRVYTQGEDEADEDAQLQEWIGELDEDNVDYEELQKAVEELLGRDDLRFQDLVEGFATGKYQLNGSFLKNLINQKVFGNLDGCKGIATQILTLAILAALFSVISSVFGNGQISDMSFYVVYLILFALLMHSFVQASHIAQQTIEKLLIFVKVAMPAYMLVVAAAGGGTMAVVFYEFFLFLVFLINWVMLRVLLPMIHMYVILGAVNHLLKEDLFSKAAELLRTVVSWVSKTVIGIVIGFQFIQGLITPYIDTFRSAALHKTLMAIPGVGNAINGVTEIAVGAGILIKNGMGVTVLLILLIFCAMPILTLGVYVLLFQILGAVIQPISDKRIVHSMTYVKEGNKLLLQCVMITCFLFVLTVAVVTAATNGGIRG